MMRISAYLLASGLQPLWGYVDTKQNPADKLGDQEKMAKKVVDMKSGRTKESRKQYRQGLGKLRGLTVQPKTKQRYNEGLNRFFDFLHRENLSLPHRRELMDDLVSDYLEFL